ncbi:heterokaryon incompatibility protein-domain-containing protein [Annulohypoxylon truncatum]|uniref:heterokaryon incompatibility protein-domain-containing protein n=1 Tax=Annulohypoxylon truncatum TaxID=327061 RepID=UPI0020087948|nr:heterokaryon incompatibility protein-domain-containing protein [Annulohypoxylon truncatum]KAI1212732.1 heterokaryon incompatibility protein-domain-containing protein [Annulohypoxylon truncatum]
MEPTHLTREQIGLSNLNQPTPCLQLSPAQLYNSLSVEESRTIRLLDLDPLPFPSDTDETPLSGTLRVASLTANPRFAALSYVWGTYSTPHPCILELRNSGGQNIKLNITTNCQDALRPLRRMYGGLCIWIDAVCINQDDEAEKSSQIKLMEDIYSWATEVYAWLGPGTDASDRVMDWCRRVAKHDFLSVASATCPPTRRNRFLYSSIALYHMMVYFSLAVKETCLAWIMLPINLGKWFRGPFIQLEQPRHFELFMKLFITGNCYLRLHDVLRLDDLRDISDREWLRRVWTFQEAILPSKLILICGHNCLDWTQVVTSFRMSAIHRDGYRPNTSYLTLNRSDYPSSANAALLPILGLTNVWMHTERPIRWEEPLKPDESQHVTYASWLQRPARGTLLSVLADVICLLAWFCQLASWAVFLMVLFVMYPLIPSSPSSEEVLELKLIAMYDLSFPEFYIYPYTLNNSVAFGVFISFLVSCLYIPCWTVITSRFKIDHGRSRDTYLAGIVQTIRTREATNDKDRSYATYGILQRLGIKDLSQSEYSKPLGQVYQELIKDFLKWNPATISLLLDAGVHSNIGGPSWVPDWSIAAKRQWIHPDYIVNLAAPIAPSTSNAWVEFRGIDGLVVRGIPNGTIKFSSGPLRRINTSGVNSHHSVDIGAATLTFIRWLRYLVRYGMSDADFEDTSQKAAQIIDAKIDSKVGTHLSHPEKILAWFTVLINSKVALQGHINTELDSHDTDAGEFYDDIIKRTYDGQHLGYVAKKLTIEICNHLAGRRNLFITTHDLPGSGPEDMVSGDTVMLIPGIPTPMILRRVMRDGNEMGDDLAYRIIGPAFICGTMIENYEKHGQNITLV